ncbi:MAG: hypothetical protein JXQ67_00545 [Campylobacterales bacterium]|nr:hypothetical protein [Campylobacterales bacterium]
MKVALIFLLTLLYYSSLFAIDINEKSSKLSVTQESFIYINEGSKLTKEQIKLKEFTPTNKDTLDFGIVPDTEVWVRFTLTNTTDKNLSKILEYANQETESILFFDGNRTIQEGMFYHPSTRETLNPIFNIELAPHESKTYYIRAACKISTFVIKLTLWNLEEFIHYEHKHETVIFVFFSIIITLLLYNFMLFLFTRDIIYFYYIAYLTAVIFFESIYLGIAQLYIFSNELSILITKATIGYIVALVIPMILFTQEFLQTQRFPKINRFLNIYLYGLPIIAILSFDNFLFDLNIMLIFFPLAFLMILSAIYALKEGTKEAGIYLFGWSFVIVSLTLSVLQSLGGYNIFEDFRYINEVAFAFEALIFSIALAYRIRRLESEKTKLSEELIKAQQHKQNELQKLVDIQTQDILSSLQEKEILYKELNHRVKNNLQMVLSLIRLQISNVVSQETKDALSTTKNRINSISKLYELLYLSDNKNFFNTQNYFQTIVETIKSSFSKDVQIIYDIRHNIDSQSAIYCGLILNELVTNSFKYAFKNTKNPVITISSYMQEELACLCVEDNGEGSVQGSKDSLGLTIVKTLADKQLNADLIIETHIGIKYTLLWNEKKNEE